MSDMKLYEAINHIDDDLIDEADISGRRPKLYAFALSAAAILLLAGFSGAALSGKDLLGRFDTHGNIPVVDTTDAAEATVPSSAQTEESSFPVTTDKGSASRNTTKADTTVTAAVTETAAESGAAGTAKVSDAASPAHVSVKESYSTAAPAGTIKVSGSTMSCTTAEAPAVTTQAAVTDISERSNDMKRVLSLIAATAMMNPVIADPASQSVYTYTSQGEERSFSIYDGFERKFDPAELELFEKIDKGLIDIDIDRNGELDMRDAALLCAYEMKKLSDNEELVEKDQYTLIDYVNIDFKAPSEESMRFLETREKICGPDLYKDYYYYCIYDDDGNIVDTTIDDTLKDVLLLVRYHITHTLKPEYFTEDYYLDTIGYPEFDVRCRYYNFDKMTEDSWLYKEYKDKKTVPHGIMDYVFNEKDWLYDIIRMEYFTDMDYDVNSDGVFDLHDVQDYLIFSAHSELDKAEYEADRITWKPEDYDISPFVPYPADEQSITEAVWNKCIALSNADTRYSIPFENQLSFYSIGALRMIKIYFSSNDFRLQYIQPEYYTDERPGCEGMEIEEALNIYDLVEYYVSGYGLVTTKLGFSQDAFDSFYEEWSTAIQNGTKPEPDINGNGVIDSEDYNIFDAYVSELYANIPADKSKVPEEYRSYLDHDYDINENGISGDVMEIMASESYIMINYPQVVYGGSADSEKEEKYLDMVGDANCDDRVNAADAVTVLQYLSNAEKYLISERGLKNADIDGSAGITGGDALYIQKLDAGVIEAI